MTATRDTGAADKLRTLLGKNEANRVLGERLDRYLHHRKVSPEKDGSFAGSIDAVEQHLQKLRTAAGDPTAAQHMTQIDAYFYLEKLDKIGAKLLPQIAAFENILNRVRQSVHDYLVEAESELLSGQTESTLFTRGESYVVERLQQVSPDALEKYRAAEQRLSEGSPEGYAQALASCRRMIKALADALYPPSSVPIKGSDGKERILGDDQFLNRLVQYAIDKFGKNTHVKLVEETLQGLGNRLNKLNSLASKGVHQEVSVVEAESCLTWTFFLTADFLRLEDGTSGLITADKIANT
ncbi:hypothetical protein [Arthrobacter sp. ISL-28]|uniref:hypothetical protein n=1 Tax=Arthrobacter sp. ISL-28 TaxID=2819108 RepID=UPI001BEB8DFD|nr:hypothetical protein [Arthrobacter sp. ISL-28]MBT2520913.1 hypothetical protein [Arthrobacter sp. ISL-28]